MNQAVANIASQKIQPVIYPQVTIWEIEDKNIFAINIPKGIAKAILYQQRRLLDKSWFG